MKTIGLLGGMSWESTMDYYKFINEEVKNRLGGLNSAKIVLYSVNFSEIEKLQHEDNWDETANILSSAAKNIENASADFLLICTNTMHIIADKIQQAISIPILHIADATAKELQKENIKSVGLLGTKFTMEKDFYKKRLIENHNIRVIIPGDNERDFIHKVIYDELCLGFINEKSKIEFAEIIKNLSEKGAEAIILGCTEIGMLVKQQDFDIKLFDTTKIHALSAVEEALK